MASKARPEITKAVKQYIKDHGSKWSWFCKQLRIDHAALTRRRNNDKWKYLEMDKLAELGIIKKCQECEEHYATKTHICIQHAK